MRKYKLILSVLIGSIVLTGCANPSEKGVEYLENGQYKEAEEQFEKAVDKDRGVGDAYRGIGIARWELEDYKGAREAFKEALDNGAKKNASIYNLLGSCEMELKNPQGALSYYRLALTAGDGSEALTQEVRFNIIAAYEQLEDWESAEAELADYIKAYPDDEKALKEAEFLKTR